MKEQLITFDTAKLAKEKGFNVKCICHLTGKAHIPINISYDVDNHHTVKIIDWNNSDTNISVPTQSLLQRWLREVHGIVVFIAPMIPHCDSFGVTIYYENGHVEKSLGFRPTWEEMLEAGLYEALKLIMA